VTQRSLHLLRTLVRWAFISVALSILLFLASGTTRISSLRAYLLAFSSMLFITMLAVDPQLARERVNPGEEAVPSQSRLLAGVLFLITVGTAAFLVGRTHLLPVPSLCRRRVDSGTIPEALEFEAQPRARESLSSTSRPTPCGVCSSRRLRFFIPIFVRFSSRCLGSADQCGPVFQLDMVLAVILRRGSTPLGAETTLISSQL